MSETNGAEPPAPAGGFFPVVYDELKRLAAARLAGERAGHSLDATALVHEAYLRLGAASFPDRSGFFRAAAVAMQRILVDHARRRKAAKRGVARTISFDGDAPALGADPDLVLDVAAALERLRGRTRSRPRSRAIASSPACRSTRPPRRWAFSRHGLPRVGLRPFLAGHRAGLGPMTGATRAPARCPTPTLEWLIPPQRQTGVTIPFSS